MTMAEMLAEQMEGTREWTLKLLADVKGDDWMFQPARGLANPLWLCGHLACSQNLLVHVRCLKTPGILEESFTKCFPIGGPVPSTKEQTYPSVEVVLRAMRDVHAKTIAAIRGMSEEFLREPAYAADGKSPHPHFRDKGGAIAHCNRHEAFHAGQLALIRRLLGKTFLR